MWNHFNSSCLRVHCLRRVYEYVRSLSYHLAESEAIIRPRRISVAARGLALRSGGKNRRQADEAYDLFRSLIGMQLNTGMLYRILRSLHEGHKSFQLLVASKVPAS